jgi:hypothetical protein
MKIQCTLPEFEDCWLEISEKWSRAERIQVATATNDQWIKLFQTKVLACNLRDESGQYLTQPAAVTWDALDQMDLRLAGFVGASLSTACSELMNLGKVNRRVSFNGFAPGK